MEDYEFLFKSREGINKSIGRSMSYKILQEAVDYVTLEENGTHTLSKTFGYQFYKQTKDVAILQTIFNHSSPNITLKYIVINQDGIDKAIKEFRIKAYPNQQGDGLFYLLKYLHYIPHSAKKLVELSIKMLCVTHFGDV